MRHCWEGDSFSCTKPKILILGESHYEGEDVDEFVGKPVADGKTESVVSYYLGIKTGSHKRNPHEKYNWTSFFTKISKTFGFDDVNTFYNNILFANYLDIYCGIKTSSAKNYLSKNENRKQCNKDLFELINSKDVEYMICFSRLAYNNLPSFAEGECEKTEVLWEFKDGRKGIASLCRYKKQTAHNHCSIELKKDLVVCCVPHPSSVGYSTSVVKEYLAKNQITPLGKHLE